MKYYDYIVDEYHHILILEYCDGKNLDKYFEGLKAGISEHEALQIVYSIGLGLYALHSNGIIHRDIKPENVIMDKGIWKICDFGLSIIANEFNSKSGTPYY